MSKKQKAMIRNLRDNYGIKPSQLKVYKRSSAGGLGYSLHNPLMDAKRKAVKGNSIKYPHASDTPFQRKNVRKTNNKFRKEGKKIGKAYGKKKPRGFLQELLNP